MCYRDSPLSTPEENLLINDKFRNSEDVDASNNEKSFFMDSYEGHSRAHRAK